MRFRRFLIKYDKQKVPDVGWGLGTHQLKPTMNSSPHRAGEEERRVAKHDTVKNTVVDLKRMLTSDRSQSNSICGQKNNMNILTYSK